MSYSESAPVFCSADDLNKYLEPQAPIRVVLSNGCFDPLHVGHIRYLRDAKQYGDFLIVALSNDTGTRRIKGPNRPAVPEHDRAALLAALRMVDAVLLFSEPDVRLLLETIRPHFHANGTDYTVESVPELETSRRLGIETVVVGDPKTHASSEVLNQMRQSTGKKEKR
jgi:rfaE bifunctional protein nucleotidyltransferase chain/domain